MQIRPFEPADQEAVVRLWDRCGLIRPWNDPRRDIARKLAVRPDLFLVGVVAGEILNPKTLNPKIGNPAIHDPGIHYPEIVRPEIVASVMVGYDGHRGWINYLAVAPEHRRQGHGRALMAEAERLLLAEGCPKVNLQVRSGNTAALEYYCRLGYGVDEVVSLGKRLIADGPRIAH